MLEPDAGKLARPVLRGGSASNGAALPDRRHGASVPNRTSSLGRLVMTPPSWRRLLAGLFVVGTPVVLAVLELFHPHPPHDLFQLDVRTWLVVHYLQLPLMPL